MPKERERLDYDTNLPHDVRRCGGGRGGQGGLVLFCFLFLDIHCDARQYFLSVFREQNNKTGNFISQEKIITDCC